MSSILSPELRPPRATPDSSAAPIMLVGPRIRDRIAGLTVELSSVMTIMSLDDALTRQPARVSALIVCADLRDRGTVEAVSRYIPTLRGSPALAFIIPPDCHLCRVQAASLGAEVILPLDNAQAIRNWVRTLDAQPVPGAVTLPTVEPAGSTTLLKSILSPDASDEMPNLEGIHSALAAVQTEIKTAGLDRWLDAVRKHHSGTYQHCMIVTGVAIGFAMALGFGRSDVEKVGLAASLHDIGKAAISLAILDKPGRLSAEETALIRSHPRLGFERLAGTPGLDPDVLQAVLRHHEYLDGSGYPDGMRAGALGDLTRIITIADVFGALIEQRSYKPPMPSRQAYGLLQAMSEDGKLEPALVRAFGKLQGL